MDKETAMHDIVENYEQSGAALIRKLEASHHSDQEAVHEVLSGLHAKMSTRLEAASNTIDRTASKWRKDRSDGRIVKGMESRAFRYEELDRIAELYA